MTFAEPMMDLGRCLAAVSFRRLGLAARAQRLARGPGELEGRRLDRDWSVNTDRLLDGAGPNWTGQGALTVITAHAAAGAHWSALVTVDHAAEQGDAFQDRMHSGKRRAADLGGRGYLWH